MRKLITLTLVSLLTFAGLFAYSQVTSPKENMLQQQEMELHGPTVVLPLAPEGGKPCCGR